MDTLLLRHKAYPHYQPLINNRKKIPFSEVVCKLQIITKLLFKQFYPR